jgi:predicted RNA-binding Zn-ribbon protein involved in translation (DUF1610 family)
MINRNPLQCLSCDAKIVTRTQIGHKDVQSHSFSCPRCGVEISFTLDLDQKNAGLKYREPNNAKWVDSEGGAIAALMFSDEIPVPSSGEGFSPFIATAHNFKDREEYGRKEGLRQRFCKVDFGYIERCVVHFERGDWEMVDKQSPPNHDREATPRGRLISLANALQAGFSLFTLNPRSAHNRVQQRIKFASSKSPGLVTDLADLYVSTGRMLKLWKELASVRRLFVNSYPALQPIVQIAYWEEELQDLSALAMGVKAFDQLRQLYIDTFETLCRLLVIGVGFEVIIAHGSLEIPMKKRNISLEEFEGFANANKREVIERFPIADLFVPLLDTELRNGIGHQSAHYEQATDEVLLYDTKDSGTVGRKIGYTDFCDRVLKLFAGFELVAMNHHSLHLHADGRLS